MPFKKGKSGNEEAKFKKGESGNPNGRPPGITNTKTRLLRWLELVKDVKNPVTDKTEKATLLEIMDAAIIKKALKGDLAAYREILDRLEGKPIQTNNNINEGGITINVKREKRGK